MLVAVTGGAGFVGRAVVRRLASQGVIVRAITREGGALEGATETRAAGDVLDADLAMLVEGCDGVVNCMARVHVRRAEDSGKALASYRATNRDFAVALAAIARREGVRRFVQISSLAAVTSATEPGEIVDDTTQPRPTSPYGQSKLEADEALSALAAQDFSIVSLRPPAIFGPGVGAWFAMLAKAARLGVPLPVGRIANARSFAFVDNVADAVALALDGTCRGTYIISDSSPLSTAELYRHLLGLGGQPDRTWRWPPALVRIAARAVLGERASSLLGNAACSGERFSLETGWSPPVSFDAALASTMGTA